MPERIQLSRAKGWRMPLNTIKVDRSTPWGNPFVVGKGMTAAECVRLYRILLSGHLCLTVEAHIEDQKAALKHVREHISELRGSNLACWCRAGQACHADTLLKLANQ